MQSALVSSSALCCSAFPNALNRRLDQAEHHVIDSFQTRTDLFWVSVALCFMQFLFCFILHGVGSEILQWFQHSTGRYIGRRDGFGRRGIDQGHPGIYVDPNHHLEPTQVIEKLSLFSLVQNWAVDFTLAVKARAGNNAFCICYHGKGNKFELILICSLY